eukprot:3354538-Pleurochrysis_carterae.AAC.1
MSADSSLQRFTALFRYRFLPVQTAVDIGATPGLDIRIVARFDVLVRSFLLVILTSGRVLD